MWNGANEADFHTPALITRTVSYQYDPLGRLLEAQYSTGERYEYAYSAVGNRTAYTETTALAQTTVTTYTYDAANRLLLSSSPLLHISYTWDQRGNLTSDGTFTYQYNAAGRMVSAQRTGVSLGYTYTPDGLRVRQTVNGVETTFAWDWASGVPELLRTGSTRYLVGAETLGQWDGAAWSYYLSDALGSVRQAVNGAGVVTSRREWTPYGVELGTAQGGLGYTGEWQDANVGMVYLRARWYQAETGRFTQVDPLRMEQSPYLYAGANPVNNTDPLGLFSRRTIARSFGLPDDQFYNVSIRFLTARGENGFLGVKRQLEMDISDN